MKKAIALALSMAMVLGLLTACGGGKEPSSGSQGEKVPSSTPVENSSKKIDILRVAFVPSREPSEIITATEPLKQMLKDEMATPHGITPRPWRCGPSWRNTTLLARPSSLI